MTTISPTGSPTDSPTEQPPPDAGASADRPRWEPPGPGSWEVAADHYSRPVTAVMRDWPAVWSRATTDMLHELAIPIDAAEMALVNDIPYIAFHAKGNHVPPRWVFRILLAVVPQMRRCEKALDRAFNDRYWLAHARHWYEVDRPAIVASQRELTRVDPDELDDAALAAHLRLVEHRMFDHGYRHLAMGMPDMLAVGLFVASCEDWGIAPADALGLLAGSSPASTGRHPELEHLREVIARHTVAGSATSTTLDDIRALGDDARTALDHYLEVHGHRVVDGYDVDCATLAERPDLVMQLATTPDLGRPYSTRDEATASARARIPAAARDDFDRMLADARAAYGVRDDNNGILVGWAVGLTRRAMLAAGRRLIDGASHALAVEATIDELVAALEGHRPLDVDELRRRRDRRRSLPSSQAPRTLGPPAPVSPTDWPGRYGMLERIFHLLMAGADRTGPLQGIGIGDRPYTGTARIVRGGLDGGDIEPGDVLVAPMTSPSYNVLLALAGAVVTEEGGLFSHAAMMARELALPAVLSVAGATELIADGATVTVDPTSGTVVVA